MLKEIQVPDIGDFSNVEIIEVLVRPGDAIQQEDSLITVESDKASMEIPSPESGLIRDMKVKIGDKISQGDIILSLEVSDAPAQPEINEPETKIAAETAAPIDSETATVTPTPLVDRDQPAANGKTSELRPSPTAHMDEERFKKAHASPAVRRFARELGADVGLISGTGPKGRILKQDVQDYVKRTLTSGATGFAVAEVPEEDFGKYGRIEIQALTRINKHTGRNTHRNWVRVPHVTQYDEADITELEAFRKSLKEEYKDKGIRITMLSFLIKAVVSALKEFPRFNASLDATQDNLIVKHYYHIGVAVDTPEGLVVPVIRDVDRKTLVEVATELSEVSHRARAGKLWPADMKGGCFSISSLGGIGGTAFTPIVNLPEVAVLGVSRATMRPVYQNGTFVPRLILPLSLSYDHRVIDGAAGARFTAYLSALLSDTRRMLL